MGKAAVLANGTEPFEQIGNSLLTERLTRMVKIAQDVS